jgi:bacteriorhodopsin
MIAYIEHQAHRRERSAVVHIVNLLWILYFAVWIIGGMILLREARPHSTLVRFMALFSVLVGPLGMIIYMGFRYIGQSIQMAGYLSQQKSPPSLP